MIRFERTIFAMPFALAGAYSAALGISQAFTMRRIPRAAVSERRAPSAVRERSPVQSADLGRVDTAAVTVNGWIPVLLFLTTGIDIVRQ